MRAIVFSKPSVSVLAMTATVFDSSPNSRKPQIGTRAGKTGRITWQQRGAARKTQRSGFHQLGWCTLRKCPRASSAISDRHRGTHMKCWRRGGVNISRPSVAQISYLRSNIYRRSEISWCSSLKTLSDQGGKLALNNIKVRKLNFQSTLHDHRPQYSLKGVKQANVSLVQLARC